MVYFENAAIRIRDMEPSDAQVITDGEIAQGWHQTVDKYLNRLRDQAEAIAARYGDTVYLDIWEWACTTATAVPSGCM